MTPSGKALLIFLVSAIFYGHSFSQENDSVSVLFTAGKSLAMSNPEKALPLFEKAMHIAQQNKDWQLYLKSVNALAALELGGRSELKDRVFKLAVSACKVLKDAKKTSEVAQLHFYVGTFYSDLTNEIDVATYHFETARNIWLSLYGEWNAKVADCYHSIGDICKYRKGDFREAEIAYEKALSIREKIDLKDLHVLFRNYYSLAQTNRSQEDFEKALSYASQTLIIAKTLNNTIYQEMTHGVLAGIYLYMNDSDQAKHHYMTAIQLNQKTQDIRTLGWYYQGLGEIFKNDRQYNQAIKSFSKAYNLYVEAKAHPNLVIHLLILLADTYSLMEDDENFVKTTRKLSRMFQSLGLNRSRQESQAFVITGNHYSRKRNYDSAIAFYQRALASSIKTFNPTTSEDNPTEAMIGFEYYVSGILYKKAAMLKEKFLISGNAAYWKKGVECLVLSEKLLSQERNMLDMQDAKWEFLDANHNIYEDIIGLLFLNKGFLSKDSVQATLLHYFEQSKARSLKDALSEIERSTQIKNEDSLLTMHSNLRRQLLALQDKLSAALEQNDDSELVTKIRAEIVALDRATEACKHEIEKQYPGYFNVKYGHQYPSLSELKKLTGSKKVILEYFWGSQWIFAMAVSDDGIMFERIGRADSISAVIDSTLTHFNQNSPITDFATYNSFATQAHTLYKILVSPFESLLRGKEKIQIVPDGPISQIPFEIMLTQQANSTIVNYRSLQYLIKSFSIGYAYSVSVLFNKPAKAIPDPSLLAISFPPSSTRESGGVGVENIAGAEEEMKMLATRFSGGEFLTDADATETNFKTIAPGFDILHLAIHGRGNVQKEFSSSLYFKSNYDSLDDGILHAYELYGVKLNAAMAVLTACESGLGKGYRGEGMMSMANAFSYSGCQNVLMSLWKVYDQASQPLMNNFYENLLEGNSIDDALRETKLRYLEMADELTADPKAWAPMVAYGSLNQIFQSRKETAFNNIVAAVAILLGVTAGVVLIRKIFMR